MITLIARLSLKNPLVYRKPLAQKNNSDMLVKSSLNINGFNLRKVIGDPNQIFVV